MTLSLSIVRKAVQGINSQTQWRPRRHRDSIILRSSQCRPLKQGRVYLMRWVSKSRCRKKTKNATALRNQSRRPLIISTSWSGWLCWPSMRSSSMIFASSLLPRNKTIYFTHCRYWRSFSSFSRSFCPVLQCRGTSVHFSSGLISSLLFR